VNRLASSVLIASIAIATSVSCRHKPSYSDIKVDGQGRLIEAPGFAGAAAKPPGAPAVQPTDVTALPPVATPPDHPVAKTPPAFFDQKTGNIKDLPAFPRSKLVSIQYGPTSGYDTLSMQVSTVQPFDQVTAFYDTQIKAEGWQIISNDRNPDSFTWRLAKSNGDDGGTVQVAKGPKPGITFVSIIRLTKLPEPKSSPKS